MISSIHDATWHCQPLSTLKKGAQYMYYYLPIIFLSLTTQIPLFNRLCSWEYGT